MTLRTYINEDFYKNAGIFFSEWTDNFGVAKKHRRN